MSRVKELLEINRQKNLIKNLFENQIRYEDVQFKLPDENSIHPILVGFSNKEALTLKAMELDSLIYRQYLYTGISNIFNEVNKEEAYDVVYRKFRSAIFHKEMFQKKVWFEFYYQDKYHSISILFDDLLGVYDLIEEKILYHTITLWDENDSDSDRYIGIFLSEYFVDLKCSKIGFFL